MAPDPKQPERKIKRYDLRDVSVFQGLIAAQPRASLALAAVCALAGVAVVAGWVPLPATARGFGLWFAVAVAWLLTLFVGVHAVRSFRRGKGDA